MAYYRRALLNLNAGMLKAAILDIDSAESKAPVEVHVHLNFMRGVIFEKNSNVTEATVAYWKALRLYDKELFNETIMETALENNDSVRQNISYIVSRLPFHGEITAARILGMKPWEEYTYEAFSESEADLVEDVEC
jgi:tetratricopeptide (TPR) repeat protein